MYLQNIFLHFYQSLLQSVEPESQELPELHEELEEQLIKPGIGVPVQAADIVSRHVLPVV